MANLTPNANVTCTDGPCGKSTNVIANPVNQKVTHIVIENKKLPDHVTRLVPIAHIASATPTLITLKCSIADVAKMAPFLTSDFIQETPSGRAYLSGGAYTSQYVVNDTGFDNIQEENIPEGELALHSGMEVKATDGRVGRLDALALDPTSGVVTDLLMRKGHLWGAREVKIPVASIDFLDAKTVYLKIDKAAVKALPTS